MGISESSFQHATPEKIKQQINKLDYKTINVN